MVRMLFICAQTISLENCDQFPGNESNDTRNCSMDRYQRYLQRRHAIVTRRISGIQLNSYFCQWSVKIFLCRLLFLVGMLFVNVAECSNAQSVSVTVTRTVSGKSVCFHRKISDLSPENISSSFGISFPYLQNFRSSQIELQIMLISFFI